MSRKRAEHAERVARWMMQRDRFLDVYFAGAARAEAAYELDVLIQQAVELGQEPIEAQLNHLQEAIARAYAFTPLAVQAQKPGDGVK